MPPHSILVADTHESENVEKNQTVTSIGHDMLMNDLPHQGDADTTEYLTFIQRLADEFQVSVEQVLPLYEQELMSLRGNARITAYLSVLTTKHVRDVLHEKKRHHE